MRIDRQTDRQRNRETRRDRQTDRQRNTQGQTDRQTQGQSQKDRQTERQQSERVSEQTRAMFFSSFRSSFSGKTTKILTLLSSLDKYVNKPIKKVVYISGMDQPAFEKFKENKNIQFYFGWSDPDIQPEKFEHFHDYLIVIDDCLGQHYDKDFIRRAVTVLYHHVRFSILLVTHSMYTKVVDGWREISQNLHYIMWCNSKRTMDQFSILARQILSRDWRTLVEIYKKVMEKEKFSCILLDLHPLSPPFAKIRTHFFDDQPTEIFVPKGQELVTQ